MTDSTTAHHDPATACLFTHLRMGALTLPNRMVMAPLTRIRADEDGTPNDLLVEYYAQRASFGLIVTEGTWPTREGRTWIGQPGIETPEHVAGWRRVTDAVHAAGGRIVMQIMHGGRISHPEITGTGRTVAPSAIAPGQFLRVTEGKAPIPTPHALEASEIATIVGQFVAGARNAIAAGMDGVQLHGANGYLINQFLAPATNHRTDQYGADGPGRARFAIEVVTAVAEAIGADRTGMRLSPGRQLSHDEVDEPAEIRATYLALAEGLREVSLAHLDVLHENPADSLVQDIRQVVGSPLIANTGFASATTRAEAAAIVDQALADGVGIGRAAIANPDLPRRWRSGAAENAPDESTFYEGGASGYTDYPALP